jgi:hypothetical protein
VQTKRIVEVMGRETFREITSKCTFSHPSIRSISLGEINPRENPQQ